MGSSLRLQTQRLHYIEDLQQPVKGHHIDIQQVEAGAFRGMLIHGVAGGAQISFGCFNKGLRSRGTWSRDKVVLGMLLSRGAFVTQRYRNVEPGDLVYDRAGSEHDSVYRGEAMFAGLAFDVGAAMEVLGSAGERFVESGALSFTHVRPSRDMAEHVSSRLAATIPRLATSELSEDGARFWMNAIIDAFATILACDQRAPDTYRPLGAVKIVQEVEALVERERMAPHIAEICKYLDISRRSLHRAFDEVLGIGPVTYLRHQRLNSARRALRLGDSALTVTKVALDHGFDDTGRFAGYYRAMFGENPSQTVKSRNGR